MEETITNQFNNEDNNEDNNDPNLRLSETFIDLEAGLYSLEPEPEVETSSIKNRFLHGDITTVLKASDPKILTSEELQQIKNDIEKNTNYSSYKEGMDAINAPENLISRLRNAFDTFELKTGRKGMTYSEMREMFG
jgi:hypothetical protein